jgi:hypothetical protein
MLYSTLKDSSQHPVCDATVEYTATVGGANQPVGYAKTDSSGTSSIPFVPLQPGTYQIQAKYGGSTSYSSSADSKSLTASAPEGNKAATTLNLALSKSTVDTQTFTVISATLKDSTGSPLARENLLYQYTTDGTVWYNITTAATGSDGVAQTNYKPSQQGAITIKVFFAGEANYLASASNEVILTVSGQNAVPWTWIGISAIIIAAAAAVVITFRFRNSNNSHPNIKK